MRMPRRLCALVILSLSIPLPAFARTTESALRFRILSRSEWGARESLGMFHEEEHPPEEPASKPIEPPTPREPSERETLCQELLRRHRKEFQTQEIVTHAADGTRYLWPRSYSASVKLLVIHHTGENERPGQEKLSGMEHVRAIYQGHTVGNGWGDIGYHYLIDTEGVIYEGRSGGSKVVGAHVYCANTGTAGIALLGNFDRERPTEEQLQSLRYILAKLSEEYDIDPQGETLFHGKTVSTILGHRDLSLNGTDCPGDLIENLLPKIRRLVAREDFTTRMLPPLKGSTLTSLDTLAPKGSTRLKIPPRGTARIELSFTARGQSITRGERIADVERESATIGLWQERGGKRLRVRDAVIAPVTLGKGESTSLLLTILAPETAGTYSLRLGNVSYTLEVSGRRVRTKNP